ncbi:MAG: transposase [Culicoidibacterales bacterium]
MIAIDGSTLSFADKSINDTTYVKSSNEKGYNKLHLNACFDGDGDYTLNFRVVHFNISKTTYESIITNLPEDAFSLDDIKTLYAMRWGIETAFRTLKYTVGLMALHTKKVAFILQELYSKLLLFNLCQLVAFFDRKKEVIKNK